MIDCTSGLQKDERTMSGYLAFTSNTSRSPSVGSTEFNVALSDDSNSVVETTVSSSSSAPGKIGSGVLDGAGGGDRACTPLST